MNVSLTPELEKLVAEKLKTGHYSSASEVIREGLRLLIEADRLKRERIESLRRDIAVGLDQANRGELVDGPKALAKMRRQIERARKKA